jgi:hypothetical protein
MSIIPPLVIIKDRCIDVSSTKGPWPNMKNWNIQQKICLIAMRSFLTFKHCIIFPYEYIFTCRLSSAQQCSDNAFIPTSIPTYQSFCSFNYSSLIFSHPLHQPKRGWKATPLRLAAQGKDKQMDKFPFSTQEKYLLTSFMCMMIYCNHILWKKHLFFLTCIYTANC